MCYTTIKESDKLVIFVKQNLTDIESINELTNTVNKIITEGENKIIIDLEDVHFINAFGISKILSIYKELKRREGELYLANLTNRIKELFNILMLDKVFKVWNYDKKQNLEPSR